jgi:hypothetical protein
MSKTLSSLAAAIALLLVTGCGSGGTDSGPAAGKDGSLPAGCAPDEVRALLVGFADSVEAGDRAAVAARLSPPPKLVRLSLYAEGAPAIARVDERRPTAIAARLVALLGGRQLRLLAVQVGPTGPFEADTRYDVQPGPSAGADLVFVSGSRSLSGKVGIDCAAGKLYVAALSLQRGMHALQLCGEPIARDREEPLACAYPAPRGPRPHDPLLTANRAPVVSGTAGGRRGR